MKIWSCRSKPGDMLESSLEPTDLSEEPVISKGYVQNSELCYLWCELQANQ